MCSEPGRARAISRVASSLGDLRERNPTDVEITVGGQQRVFDAILHRHDGALLVELEVARGARPFSFENTYLATRAAVGELNRAGTLGELYEITARSVRDLTGFDRVMVYRYDADYNGEVVAEAKLDDLNSFLGLHYPASDIPAQARALYEKNWIRLIDDVDYVPAPLVPVTDPSTGAPQDLTYSTLRSVSPIHVEYLQNMGVGASMSISLLRDGRLWGLIACHHYSGPHNPPYGVRAAAEFLGSTLSLRLVDQEGDDILRERLAAQAVLAKIASAARNESDALADVLLGAPDLLDLVPAGGVTVGLQGAVHDKGEVPADATVLAVVEWARSTGEDLVHTDRLTTSVPQLDADPARAAGALVVLLPDDQFVVWFRPEYAETVDWGGDPHNKAIARQEGDTVRLSPRKSFDRWREVVRGRCRPWSPAQSEVAGELRHHVVEALYARTRAETRLVETLQRSLLPPMPVVPGWTLSAHYRPSAGGRIGGDWYDAFAMPDGRFAVVLGDVAGHGIGAAGTMAQLCNALRAYLVAGATPERAVSDLNEFTVRTLRGSFATLAVACLDLDTGHGTAVIAGHPRPLLVAAGGDVGSVEVPISPPLGLPRAEYRVGEFTIARGEGLVLFSDGVVERRDEDLDLGVQRLGRTLTTSGPLPSAQKVLGLMPPSDIADDATMLTLYRAG